MDREAIERVKRQARADLTNRFVIQGVRNFDVFQHIEVESRWTSMENVVVAYKPLTAIGVYLLKRLEESGHRPAVI